MRPAPSPSSIGSFNRGEVLEIAADGHRLEEAKELRRRRSKRSAEQ